MKFGRQLSESAYPKFRNYYIAYKDLKLGIKIITGEVVPTAEDIAVSSPLIELIFRHTATAGASSFRRTPESQFQDLLDHELAKINNFSNIQFLAIEEGIRELLRDITGKSESVQSLANDIVAFDEYIRLNYTGFRKALKKFDKCNESNSSNWFLRKVATADFMTVDIDRLVTGIAVVRRLVRKQQHIQVEPTHRATTIPLISGTTSPPFETHSTQFSRQKYFLPPEDLIKLEMDLLTQMDAVFGVVSEIGGFTEQQLVHQFAVPAGTLVLSAKTTYREWVVIFEKPTAHSYSQYICRRTKVQMSLNDFCGYAEPVFSVRWNEFQNRLGRCTVVKECHGRWTSRDDSNLFVDVPQKLICQIIDKSALAKNIGLPKMENPGDQKLLTEFIAFVKSQYRPCCMYSYQRSLFVLSEEGVYAGLDQDIKFAALVKGQLSKFETVFGSGILFSEFLTQRAMTVWLPKNALSPLSTAFLSTVTARPSVTTVSAFSKAVHAEAVLLVMRDPQRPQSTGGLPNWFNFTTSEQNKRMRIATIDEVGINSGSPIESKLPGDALTSYIEPFNTIDKSSSSVDKLLKLPTSSPKVNFDVLPKGEHLFHDIITSARETVGVVTPGGPYSKQPTQTHYQTVPAPAVPYDRSSLTEPLLERRPSYEQLQRHEQSASAHQSLWDQFMYVFFGSGREAAAPPSDEKKVEAKTFLANERTFLNWSYTGFIISALAVTVKAVNPSDTASFEAGLLSAISVFILVWSLNVYRMRVLALRTNQPVESLLVSSKTGATVVALSVAAALFYMWVVRVTKWLKPGT